jgi:plasmid stabilization system protein ParE
MRVAARIRDAADSLRYFPESGRIGDSPGTREKVVHGFPYIIVYEVRLEQPGEIVVLAVFHGAQRR